jgi:hypothetical protein
MSLLEPLGKSTCEKNCTELASGVLEAMVTGSHR